MPEISRFFGIAIRMYFLDHAPPHFHAYYAGAEAQIGIQRLACSRAGFRHAPWRSHSNGLHCIRRSCTKTGGDSTPTGRP